MEERDTLATRGICAIQLPSVPLVTTRGDSDIFVSSGMTQAYICGSAAGEIYSAGSLGDMVQLHQTWHGLEL